MKKILHLVSTGLAGVLVLLWPANGFSQHVDPSVQTLIQQRLEKQVLSLRSPDPRRKLVFASNGVAVTPRPGVASLDRDVFVDKVTLKDAMMKIRAQRVFYMWNSKSDRLEATMGEATVELDIGLPEGNISESEIVALLDRVFESSADQKQRECTPEETMLSRPFLTQKPSGTNSPSAAPGSKADLKTICLPTGVRGFLVDSGVTAPRALSAPDPEYSASARKQKTRGSALYGVLVNEKGSVSDVLLIRSLEPSLNYNGAAAIRNWRFRPATFQGEPIPVVLRVEINFQIY